MTQRTGGEVVLKVLNAGEKSDCHSCENRNPVSCHWLLTIRCRPVDLELSFLDFRLRGNDELHHMLSYNVFRHLYNLTDNNLQPACGGWGAEHPVSRYIENLQPQ